jgi:hypothetical protein
MEDTASTFMSMMLHHDQLKMALQTSSSAAEVVVLLWSALDLRTQTPLVIAVKGPGAGKPHGCLINDLFHGYTVGSKDAKVLSLSLLGAGGSAYTATQNLLTITMARSARMKRGCEKSEWDPRTITRNYRDLVESFDEFVKLGEPYFDFSALSERRFIYEFMSGICAITKNFGKLQEPILYLIALTLVSGQIITWTNLDCIRPADAAIQLIQGGVVELVPDMLIDGPQDANPADRLWSEYLCAVSWCTGWLACHSVYPAVLTEMDQAIVRITEEKRSKIRWSQARKNEWTVCAWTSLMGSFSFKLSVWNTLSKCIHNGEVLFCDNISVSLLFGISRRVH